MDNFLGELRVFAFGKIPEGWAACEGQQLPVTSNQALFSLLGNRYGGDGVNTFNLPDLRGRVLLTQGISGNVNYPIAAKAGSDQITLTENNVGPHSHSVMVADAVGTALAASGNSLSKAPGISGIANEDVRSFVPDPGTTQPPKKTTIAPDTISIAGAAAPHDNHMPTIALQICIALTGLYPMRN